MSTSISISEWRFIDVANLAVIGPDGWVADPPERCWFAIENMDVDPPEFLFLTDGFDVALHPRDEADEIMPYPDYDLSSSDPVRWRLAEWFHFFRDKSVSMGQYVNGEFAVIEQLHRMACHIHDRGKIRFSEVSTVESSRIIVRPSITNSDALRVITQFPCKPISDNTRHFLSPVLRAMERWRESSISNDSRPLIEGQSCNTRINDVERPKQPRGWSDISFRLNGAQDRHKLYMKCGDDDWVDTNAIDLRFRPPTNRRKPSVQWDIFMRIIFGGGSTPVVSEETNSKCRLCTTLSKRFDVKEDPIVAERGIWRAKFNVDPPAKARSVSVGNHQLINSLDTEDGVSKADKQIYKKYVDDQREGPND